jgi:hypothetical protein
MKNINETGSDDWQPEEHFVEGISLPGKTLRASIIWRSAPILLKEDAESVAMFRRRVESEVSMLILPESRPTPKKMEHYLKHRASFMNTSLYVALFKMGVLDCVLMCDKPAFGFAWIKESLPILSQHPLTKDMASFYYREAACFAGKHGKWKQALDFARKGVKQLPEDVSKILWAAELHRVLAAALLKLKRYKECKDQTEVVHNLAKAHGENYGPALWLRVFVVKEELARATGDRSSELVAKLSAMAAIEDSMPFYEVQRAQEVRLAWCLHERPKWLDEAE